jgi:hypothetical protein
MILVSSLFWRDFVSERILSCKHLPIRSMHLPLKWKKLLQFCLIEPDNRILLREEAVIVGWRLPVRTGRSVPARVSTRHSPTALMVAASALEKVTADHEDRTSVE